MLNDLPQKVYCVTVIAWYNSKVVSIPSMVLNELRWHFTVECNSLWSVFYHMMVMTCVALHPICQAHKNGCTYAVEKCECGDTMPRTEVRRGTREE